MVSHEYLPRQRSFVSFLLLSFLSFFSSLYFHLLRYSVRIGAFYAISYEWHWPHILDLFFSFDQIFIFRTINQNFKYFQHILEGFLPNILKICSHEVNKIFDQWLIIMSISVVALNSWFILCCLWAENTQLHLNKNPHRILHKKNEEFEKRKKIRKKHAEMVWMFVCFSRRFCFFFLFVYNEIAVFLFAYTLSSIDTSFSHILAICALLFVRNG